ncbi:MAG: EamA family transporter [Bryobacteraceae bacterium]
MGHLYLVLAVVSLGCLGVLHKVADHRRCRPQAINAVLFLAAGLVLTAVTTFKLGVEAWTRVPPQAWWVATACGLCASVAILHFQHGVRHGRISTSWLIVNLSTIVPTILSILIYGEAVSPRRAASLALALLALVLLWFDRSNEEAAAGGNG